tara:strand:+ start:1035 stop:2204 length:1170 start_codon:yes stop_codon:yes gene_type:complete
LKKLIYFSTSIVPSKYANSVHVMKMCEALAQNGQDVTLFGIKNIHENVDVFDYYGVEKVFDIKSFPMLKIPGKNLYNPLTVLSAGIYLLVSSAHIFFDRSAFVYTRDPYGAFALAILGQKFVWEIHELPSSRFKNFLFTKVLKSNAVVMIVCISEKMKSLLFSQFSFIENYVKTMVAHDGATPSNEILKPQHELRKELDLPQNSFIAGYTGNLFSGRGIELIFEIAEKLQDVTFVIVGGHDEDLTRLRQFLEKGSFSNIDLHGFQPPHLIPYYLKAFDILLMPYQKKVSLRGNKRDTSEFMSPMKMFEYMASGRPIISSRLPVLMEVLSHDQNALLAEPDVVNEWLSAVTLLKENRQLRDSLAQKATEDVMNYTWEERADSVLKHWGIT